MARLAALGDENPVGVVKVVKVEKVTVLRILEGAVINLTYGPYLDLKL